MTTTATATQPTAKQLDMITRLAAERITNAPVPTPTTKSEASFLIGLLLDAPRKPATNAATPGYYLAGGRVVRVQANQANTATYAKVLIIKDGQRKGTWTYTPGLAATLATATPLTVEQAAAMGHATGVCVICAAELTDPKSIERGIGPVCIKRL
jgi:hypothetical protein